VKLPKKLSVNKVIIYLTLSDVFSWGPFTIVSMLAGLYLASKLGEDIVKFVGIGTSIYFLTRAMFQVPIGLITDKYRHDKDEILILFVGVLLMGVPFLFYPFIEYAYQYFILQFIFGLGVSLNVTNWRKLFALNLDAGREGINYGIYEMVMSISIAILSIFGGIIANKGGLYFDTVMSAAGIIMMLGSTWIIFIYKLENRQSSNIVEIPVDSNK
jgi:MFS family permease